MLAVVKERPEVDFVFKEVQIPVPKADEVLVKVEAVGICGTDIPIFKGTRKVEYPLVPGHEFAGVIVKTGDSVRGFEPGDRVAPGLVVHCGVCSYCRQGLESLCDDIYEIGIHVNGAFTDYVVVPEKTLHRIPEEMTFNQGASIDPVASAYRPVRKAAVTSKDFVVIVGPGPIGLYALQIARAEGASGIALIGTAGDEKRLTLAKELGADHAINGAREDPVEAIRALTGGRMADVVLEATGAPAAMPVCIQCLRKNGRLSLVGLFHQPVPISLGDIVRRELSLKGSICYTWLDFQTCIELVASGKIKVDPLITHEYPLKKMDRALDVVYRRESIKTILHPHER